MGRNGTDVAREASDMIISDDNFASIVEAVEVGRIIFDNIRKVVFFLLSSSAGVVLFIGLSMLFNFPLPFVAAQILWINLITNGLQDVAMAYEPGEDDVSERPPRDPEEPIINRSILSRLVLTGLTIGLGTLAVFKYQLDQGASLDVARTAAFNTVVFFQFYHLFNSRSFTRSVFAMNHLKNKFLFISILFALGAQLAVLNIPGLHFILRITSLPADTMLLTVLLPLTIILVIELDKLVRKRLSRG